MPEFIKGRTLSRLLFTEVVQPLLSEHYPRLEYSAGLFGYGSDVLGFDTEMSTDHDWGPRMQLFLNASDACSLKEELFSFFGNHLPYQFHGYSTHFGTPNQADKGTRHLESISSGVISHRVETYYLESYLDQYLGHSLDAPIQAKDWLVFPQQKLRSLANGAVYSDGLCVLQAMREKLAWYPHDVWLFLMASAWQRIGQEEHLMGRCGIVGDEIGSALLGASISRVLMQLCFLMDKQYAPYPKWFGSAFQELPCANWMTPMVDHLLMAVNWQEREQGFCKAAQFVLNKLNELRLLAPFNHSTDHFFGRPIRVIWGGAIAEALQGLIQDPWLRQQPLIGGIDLITSSTDVLENVVQCQRMKCLYQESS